MQPPHLHTYTLTHLSRQAGHTKRAFSLIEIAIAIALFALIFGGMLAVFERGAIASKKTQQQAAAYNLARVVLEQYSDWNTLDQLNSAGCATDALVTNTIIPYSPLNQPACLANAFSISTLNTIAYTPGLAISDGPITPLQLKRLDVTITWTDGVTPKSITLSTLKANY